MADVMDPADETPLAACEEALHAVAAHETGLEDFGDDEYREGLQVLLRACDQEAQLAPAGRMAVKEQVRVALRGRLLSQAAFADYPDHEKSAIEAPIVIIGMPRTASTALHRMLSRDPALQGLELWVAEAPMPRPPRESWPDVPAFAECDARTRAAFGSPEMRAVHEIDADEVDECWHLFLQSFGSVTFECNFGVPSYSRWWAGWDMRPAYRRYRRNLQLIGHREPGRRWLLKDANHMFHLESFLEVFPDARIVTTMRDPVKLIPSVCSLTALARGGIGSGFDLHRHGEDQLALWARGLRELTRVGAKLSPERFYEMGFDDFQADPLGEVRRIYERFGLALSSSAESAMRRWREENQRGRHGAHRYAPEDYGLTPEGIRAAFEPLP